MFRSVLMTSRVLAALCVCAGIANAQQSTPPLQGARTAGELVAGSVGALVGAYTGIAVVGVVNYLVTHHQEISNPRAQRFGYAMMFAGGAVGASTSAWLVSRADHQTSNWGANLAVTTAVTAVAYRYAGWPYTRGKSRPASVWRRAAPLWMPAIAATIVASATRERR
jgi:hypothetical protein